MFKYLFVLSFSFIGTHMYAQQHYLHDMDEKSRNEYLIKLSYEIVNNLAPEWNRGKLYHEILPICNYNYPDSIKLTPEQEKRQGKSYYLVRFSYDESFQKQHGDYRTRAFDIFVWDENGEPEFAFFDLYCVDFEQESLKERMKRGVKESEKIKYIPITIDDVMTPKPVKIEK